MGRLRETLKFKFDPKNYKPYPYFKSFNFTGLNLIDEINALDPDLVIDVGCGNNRFKGHIKNLIGFDQEPYPFADLHMSIEEINFRKESADVVLALGTIQFGNKEMVRNQLEKIISWTKPGGFIVMRTFHQLLKPVKIPFSPIFFFWDQTILKEFTSLFQLEIINGPKFEPAIDENNTVLSDRMSWWWKKPGVRKKYSIDNLSCEIKERL